MKPSSSTIASVGIGLPVAIVVSWAFHTATGIVVPGEVQSAFGVIVSAVAGYAFKGGMAADTEES